MGRVYKVYDDLGCRLSGHFMHQDEPDLDAISSGQNSRSVLSQTWLASSSTGIPISLATTCAITRTCKISA